MRQIGSALISAILVATPVSAQTVRKDPSNGLISRTMQALPVRVGGRVVKALLPKSDHLPPGSVRYTHEWPGVYFETAFSSSSVVLKFDDPTNGYRLQIDDSPPIALDRVGAVEIEISNLPRGRHEARLEKLTESIGSPAAFEGFYARNAEPQSAVLKRRRQIEFIGDSSMTGFGVHSPTRQCTADQAREFTDTQADYAALTAKHFHADYQINAISGAGIVRNYGGSDPGVTMPLVYHYAVPSRRITYRDPSWQPQIAVFKLDADFATPLKAGEKWSSMANLASDYARHYARFIEGIHRRSPSTRFLLWWPDPNAPINSKWAPTMEPIRKNILAYTTAAGIRVNFLYYGDLGLEGTGCDSHPNVQDHIKIAGILVRYLDAHPQLWHGR